MAISALRILSRVAAGIGILFLLSVGVLVFWDWWEGIYWRNFKLNDQYEVSLEADDCTACFLDWPIDFQIEITDTQTGQSHEFEIYTGEGPQIRFLLSEEQPQLIQIAEYGYNYGMAYSLNLEDGKMSGIHPDSDESFIPVAEINTDFEVVHNGKIIHTPPSTGFVIMKTILFAIGTLLKIPILIGGIALAIYQFVKGTNKKDPDRNAKTLKYFFGTIGIVFLLMIIEFLIAAALS